MIRIKLEGEDAQQMTLMKVYDQHLKVMIRLLGKKYTKTTIIKYKNARLRLSQYLRSRYKRKDIFLYEPNYDFIKGFEIFLREKFDTGTSTVYKHYQRFTLVLSLVSAGTWVIILFLSIESVNPRIKSNISPKRKWIRSGKLILM